MKSSGVPVRTSPHGDVGGDLDEVFLKDKVVEEPEHTRTRAASSQATS